jgi:hypothetical protein
VHKPPLALILCSTIILACGDADSPEPGTPSGLQAATEESLSEDPLIAPILRPWTGDLPGIQKRRAIRVLVSYSPTNYFIRAGRTLGFEAELMNRDADFLNQGVSDRQLETEMVFVPVSVANIHKYFVAYKNSLDTIVRRDRERQRASEG